MKVSSAWMQWASALHFCTFDCAILIFRTVRGSPIDTTRTGRNLSVLSQLMMAIGDGVQEEASFVRALAAMLQPGT